VVVTATRTEARRSTCRRRSTASIGSDGIRDARLQVNISESLGGVPGLLARDRQNYAQDVQISVRGFGARSTFGIRGVRLYVDGIPATLPDGQGQISNVELGSVDRIEVLRGPFSALYGNSSGGVIQVFTEEGAGRRPLGFSVAGGSDGVLRCRRARRAGGSGGVLGYVVSASRLRTDGYRDHSAAERDLGNVKLTLQLDDASNADADRQQRGLPKAQDPLGLTRAQYEADPRSVDPSALTYNTRKSVDQTQFGLIYERRLDARTRCARWSTRATAAPSSSRRSRRPHAGAEQSAQPGRRDRAGAQLQRHRPALDREDAPERRAVHGRRRCRLRHPGRASPGLPELRRHGRPACRAHCAATRTTTSRASTSTCRPRGNSPHAGR
jgi:outer membrane receptor for Fe3+-dicitrate